jgi:hypothetical protein
MAHDGARALLLVEGAVWAWDGARWARVEVTGAAPDARVGHGLAWDRERQALVVVGGTKPGAGLDGANLHLADTWELRWER